MYVDSGHTVSPSSNPFQAPAENQDISTKGGLLYCPGTTKRRIEEAVIKSAASAASMGFAGERRDDGPACGRRGTWRSPANPREDALAADLITASLIRLLAVPGQYLNDRIRATA